MSVDPNRLNELYQKFLLNQCSEEELQHLVEALSEENASTDANEIVKLFDVTWESIDIEAVRESSHKEPVANTKAPIVKITKTSISAVAALLALVVLSTSLGILYYKPVHKSKVQLVAKDVAPGGNKATLTLANGTVINLDTLSNGAIKQQGDRTILRTVNGQVVYDNPIAATNAVQYSILSTPKGGQYNLVLPDGTKVWLNASSSLKFPTVFNGSSRTVELTGEGYFEVVHNEKQPFIVHANNVITEDIGTSFNISAYSDEDEVRTTLVEGAVKVNNHILKPGQQANINGPKLSIQHVDVEDETAWIKGQLLLNGDNIQAIMRKIGRWYNVDIRFEGSVPKSTFFGKVDRNIYLSEMLNALSAYGVKAYIDGKTVIVSSK